MIVSVSLMKKPLSVGFLHHALALAVLLQLMLGFGIELFGDINHFFITLHKSVGFTTIWLTLALGIKHLLGSQKPPYPASMPIWQQRLAHLTHIVLFFSVLTMALSGYLSATLFHSSWELFFIWPMPAWLPKNPAFGMTVFKIHIWCAWVVLGFTIMHILGAFYHMIRGDGILKRSAE
jgi:cytochrome b561